MSWRVESDVPGLLSSNHGFPSKGPRPHRRSTCTKPHSSGLRYRDSEPLYLGTSTDEDSSLMFGAASCLQCSRKWLIPSISAPVCQNCNSDLILLFKCRTLTPTKPPAFTQSLIPELHKNKLNNDSVAFPASTILCVRQRKSTSLQRNVYRKLSSTSVRHGSLGTVFSCGICRT